MANLPAYQDVDQFWSGLVDRFGNALRANRPSVDRVGAIVSTNWYQVYGAGQSYDANSEELPRLSLSRPTVGKRVLVIRTDSGERIVLGGIFEAGDNDDVAYQTELDAVNTALDGRLDALEALNPVLIGTVDDHVLVTSHAQSSADTGSTTSTVNYATAISLAFTLPAGTWSVDIQGGCGLLHSAGNTARWATRLDGTEQTARTGDCPSASPNYRMCVDNYAQGAVASGAHTATFAYRASAAGTVSANNPWLIVVAVRTS